MPKVSMVYDESGTVPEVCLAAALIQQVLVDGREGSPYRDEALAFAKDLSRLRPWADILSLEPVVLQRHLVRHLEQAAGVRRRSRRGRRARRGSYTM